jgi:uncharacterized protein (DUF2062 family)
MRRFFQSETVLSARQKLMACLQTGLTPRQLAFTLALGFAIGCIPLLGVTTAICALAAVVLRLNMPVIQVANWAAMPFQMILLVPFLRLGQKLSSGQPLPLAPAELAARIQAAPWHAVTQMSGLLVHALLAWLITAGPALVLLTILLTSLLHRVAKQPAVELT